MQILKKLLGGRPMKFVEFRFRDIVSHRCVNLYTDSLGRHWQAESPWSLFRVRQRETAFVSYPEADRMLLTNTGWRVVPEDLSSLIGYVHLERLL